MVVEGEAGIAQDIPAMGGDFEDLGLAIEEIESGGLERVAAPGDPLVDWGGVRNGSGRGLRGCGGPRAAAMPGGQRGRAGGWRRGGGCGGSWLTSWVTWEAGPSGG